MSDPSAGITGPPDKMRQNETPYWEDVPYTDKFDNEYDARTYTLTYVFAGPISAPVSLVAQPQTVGVGALGWVTTFDAVNSAKMIPGLYWWQAVLTAAGPPAVRIVAAEGEMTVEADLAHLTGPYDGRSQAEIALANAEAALITFQASGGRIRQYTIANRHMTFQDDIQLLALIGYLRGRVEAEKQQASGGDRRHLRVGFAPPSSGVPTDSSRSWPWW